VSLDLPEDEDPGEEVEEGDDARHHRLPGRHIGDDTRHERDERVGHIQGEEQHEDEVEDRKRVEHEPHQEVGGDGEGEHDEEVKGDGDGGLGEHERRRAVSPRDDSRMKTRRSFTNVGSASIDVKMRKASVKLAKPWRCVTPLRFTPERRKSVPVVSPTPTCKKIEEKKFCKVVGRR